jgi:hypothetical protein
MALFVALHLGIEFSLTVGLFSAASIVAWAVFLPSEAWNHGPLAWLGLKLSDLRLSPPTPIAEAKLEVGAACRAEPSPTRQAGPTWSGRVRFAWQAICAFLLLYTVGGNVASLFPTSDQAIPVSALRLGQATNILQRWDMFGRVPRNDGWYTARARLRDGAVVDILRGGAAYDDAKPALVSAIFPNQHWRYFFQALAQPYNESFRQEAAEHLYRAWNERHEPERQIVNLELIYFHEDTDRDHSPGEFVSEHLAKVTAPDAGSGAFDELLNSLNRGSSLVP